jgi:folate-binding protein YgfZ
LLTPQGKIMFDFLVSRAGADAFLLECRADIADDFVRRLMLYRLRAKIEISKRNESVVFVSWDSDSGSPVPDSGTARYDSAAVRDIRFPAGKSVFRSYGTGPQPTGMEADWNALRISCGIAESGADYTLGDAFPHDVLLDELGAIGFKKGCYVGQEVVSRMQHRGTARRRVLIVSADRPLPAAGTEIRANDRVLGTLGTVSGNAGIAIVRIDRVKEAVDASIPILAGDVPVRLSIPEWAKFTFPQDATGTEDA